MCNTLCVHLPAGSLLHAVRSGWVWRGRPHPGGEWKPQLKVETQKINSVPPSCSLRLSSPLCWASVGVMESGGSSSCPSGTYSCWNFSISGGDEGETNNYLYRDTNQSTSAITAKLPAKLMNWTLTDFNTNKDSLFKSCISCLSLFWQGCTINDQRGEPKDNWK